MVADQMVLSTIARGIRSSFQLRKSELLISNRDLEDYEIVVRTSTDDAVEPGTRIELRDLNQNLAFPNPERMRALLIREYLRSSGDASSHRVVLACWHLPASFTRRRCAAFASFAYFAVT